MGQIRTSLGIADVSLDPRSKETGFSSVPFEYSATTITTLWEALDANNSRITNVYGTVVIIGNVVTGTTRIAVNGINTTQVINGETYALTSDPFNYVALTYTTSASQTTTLSVSISANYFEY